MLGTISILVIFFLALQIILSITSGAFLVKENPDKKSNQYIIGTTTIIYSIIWLILVVIAGLDFYNIFNFI